MAVLARESRHPFFFFEILIWSPLIAIITEHCPHFNNFWLLVDSIIYCQYLRQCLRQKTPLICRERSQSFRTELTRPSLRLRTPTVPTWSPSMCRRWLQGLYPPEGTQLWLPSPLNHGWQHLWGLSQRLLQNCARVKKAKTMHRISLWSRSDTETSIVRAVALWPSVPAKLAPLTSLSPFSYVWISDHDILMIFISTQES